MSQMAYEDFSKPSELPGGGGSHPSMAQLAGRLVHIMPTAREDGVTTDLQPTPHTRLTVELTFLDGTPIEVVLDKQNQVKATFTPPVQPGRVMVGRFMNQSWFVARLKDRVNVPGFPGIVGVITQIPGKRNPLWALKDPTPAQMDQVRAWFQWRQEQGSAAVYVPAPPAPPVPTGYAPAAPQQPMQPPAQQQYASAPGISQQSMQAPASPFAQQPPAAPPVGPWAPQQPPAGMTPVPQPTAAPAAPVAPQPGPEVPPWQR